MSVKRRAVRIVVLDVRGHVLLCTVGARKAGRPGRPDQEIPGGSLEDDETLEAAAQREVLEETGLNLPLEGFKSLGLANFDTQAEGAWEINLFCVRVNKEVGALVPQDPTEIAAIDFYPPDAAPVNAAIAVYGFRDLEELLSRECEA